ncbi:MAG: hypothetical protein AAF664_23445 [Planctomycetota bacterium]
MNSEILRRGETMMTGLTILIDPTMRLRLACFGLLLLGLGFQPVFSQDSKNGSSSETDGEEVEELVDQLDASSRKQRIEAQQLLLKMGPDILPSLPDGRGMSIEASGRLEKLREMLVKAKARQAVLQRRTAVRLDDIETLDDALTAISFDSGIEFQYDGDRSVAVPPVGAPLSVWHAIDYVLDSTNLDVDPYGGMSGALALVQRQHGRPSRVDSAAYTGVYRLEPTLISSRRSLKDKSLSELHVNMEIAWPPNLTPIGLTIPVAELAAVTSDGEELRPQSNGQTIDIATSPSVPQSEFYLPFDLPPAGTPELKSVSGVIEALLPGKSENFELELGSPGSSQSIDAMTVTLESVRRRDGLVEVRLAVDLKNADRSLESHRHWIFENEVHIVDQAKQQSNYFSFEVFRQGPTGVGVAYLFDLPADLKNYRLIYRSPVAVARDKASFLLGNVPLP